MTKAFVNHPAMRILEVPVDVYPGGASMINLPGQTDAKALFSFMLPLILVRCSADFVPEAGSAPAPYYYRDHGESYFDQKWKEGDMHYRILASPEEGMGEDDWWAFVVYELKQGSNVQSDTVVGYGRLASQMVEAELRQRGHHNVRVKAA